MTVTDFLQRMEKSLPDGNWQDFFDAVNSYKNQIDITRSDVFNCLTGLRLNAMNGSADEMKRCERFTNAVDAVFDDERLEQRQRSNKNRH